MQYVLGLDNGGTLTKAAIFAANGTEMGAASRQTPVLTPAPGLVERDIEAVWEANCACIRDVIEKSGVNSADIAAVSVTGHGKGLYAWGDGKPTYNGIASHDNRAWRIPQRWRESSVFDRLYPQLCQPLLPGQQASLLLWLKEQEPEVYDSIRWVFSVKDYIRFRLTGEAYSEMTDISGSGLMDVKNARIDKTMLEALGIGEMYDKLPPLKYSYELCGAITAEAAKATGLSADTPVAGGMFDIDACAVAMNVTTPQELCTVTGTWSINEFISPAPITGGEMVMNSLFAIPGYYLIEECSPTGAGNLEWALANLLSDELPGQELYQKASAIVSSVPPEECNVIYLPYLYGSNAHPLAKASFVGLTSFHGKAHMLRAVYESAAFTAKVHIDRLLKLRQAPRAVRMAGGATNSLLWVQMFADVLGLPVEMVSGTNELSALGCAMAGFVAIGTYKDYQEAARSMVRIAPPVYPNPALTRIYAEKYRKFTAVMHALDTVWDQFEI